MNNPILILFHPQILKFLMQIHQLRKFQVQKNTISVGNRLWKAEYTKEDKEWVKYVDKILRLGWKMDAEGKVHRDTSGEVEYDSDEDPPTPPVGEMPEFLLRKYAPASQ